MESIKFGLMLSIIPFTCIFLFVIAWWALVDISLRKLAGPKKLKWTLLVLFLPALGSFLYNLRVRRQEMGEVA